MKKYFVKETEEEILFGEELSLTFHKEMEDGKVTVVKNIMLTEETLEPLINMGFIEECEADEEENELLDFGQEDLKDLMHGLSEFKEAVAKDIEDFDLKIEGFEKRIGALEKRLAALENLKNASSKK